MTDLRIMTYNIHRCIGVDRKVSPERIAAVIRSVSPDIVVPVDTVFEKKTAAIWQLESQIESLWATGNFEKVVPIPDDPAGREQRRKQQWDRQAGRDGGVAKNYRSKLVELYGQDKAEKVKYAEAFELCEYGRRPSVEELKKLFPAPKD